MSDFHRINNMSTNNTLRKATSYSDHPKTCPHCERDLIHPDQLDEGMSWNQIYRAHRRTHFDWYNVPEDDEGKYLSGEDEDDGGLPEECKIDTQTFEVEFHYEMVESVTVEAANKHEAKEIAELERNYDGEILQTIHTERRAWGEPSQATKDYLERLGLLPNDWDGEIDVSDNSTEEDA